MPHTVRPDEIRIGELPIACEIHYSLRQLVHSFKLVYLVTVKCQFLVKWTCDSYNKQVAFRSEAQTTKHRSHCWLQYG